MTIRDQSTRTLGEALALGLRGDPTPGYRHTPRTDRQYEALAERILAASPTLAADLDLATAWRMAQEALPEGFVLRLLMTTWAPKWMADAWHRHDPDDGEMAMNDDPTEALVALTAALRDRAR